MGKNVGIYLSDKAVEYLKNKPQGYLSDLLKRDMEEDGVKKVEYKPSKKSGSESSSDFVKDIYACKECGQVLCAGKCINKFCRRFKK